jgi:hypothetical protein
VWLALLRLLDAPNGIVDNRRLGARPSSAYVIDPAGTIVFRAQWSTETDAIGEVLAAIAVGRAPPMGLMASVADLFFFLPRRARGGPAMLLTMAILGALAVAAVVAM